MVFQDASASLDPRLRVASIVGGTLVINERPPTAAEALTTLHSRA